jgi:hypothetical protein
MGRIHCLETISGSTQPRRESPNKDIKLNSPLNPYASRSKDQEHEPYKTEAADSSVRTPRGRG